jgi:hypothetical protein
MAEAIGSPLPDDASPHAERCTMKSDQRMKEDLDLFPCWL